MEYMTDTIIIGCGYVGTRLARHYLEQGVPVTGLIRSEGALARLAQAGVPGVLCDLSRDEPSGISFDGVNLFYFAPPPEEGIEDRWLRRAVATFSRVGNPRRILYISTTGVYGDCQGAWVDETRPAEPRTERSLRRWDAEQALRGWSQSTKGELVILRVAGIYGPGRLPLERLRQGIPLVRPEESPFTNRIHVEDLVRVCAAAMERGKDGEVYNACDGHPSTMTDYFLRVADAAGLPHPPLIPLTDAARHLSAGMMSYLSESRRLGNQKLRDELQVDFRYPNLADGLNACQLT